MNITKMTKEMQKKNMLWGDNSFREEKKIWFVSCDIAILYCLNLEENRINSVACLPLENNDYWRQNSRCFKYKNSIWCIPDKGKNIYIYDLKKHSWKSVKIANTCSVAAVEFWKYKERLYVISRELRQIIELDLIRKDIEGYYELTQNIGEKMGCSTFVEPYIFCVSSFSSSIFKFDCITKKIDTIQIPKIDDQLYTICFDGNRFWFTGKKRNIYIWDKDKNKIEILNKFPADFGVYNFNNNKQNILDCESNQYEVPTFLVSNIIGNNIWLIPWQTNEVLYINKDTLKINSFPLPEEVLTTCDIKEQILHAKYLFLYVWKKQIIGLYSLKNKWIIEIDCLKQSYRIINYDLSLECILANCNFLIWNTQSSYMYFEGELCLGNLIDLVFNKKEIFEKDKLKKEIGAKIFKSIEK